ncbi:MAG: hypothetical protein ACXWQ5_18500 [Ktedonobacterales bacterium]
MRRLITLIAIAGLGAFVLPPIASATSVQGGKTYVGQWHQGSSQRYQHGNVTLITSLDRRTVTSFNTLTNSHGWPGFPKTKCVPDFTNPDPPTRGTICPPAWDQFPLVPVYPFGTTGTVVPYAITPFVKTPIVKTGLIGYTFQFYQYVPWWPTRPPWAGHLPFSARINVHGRFVTNQLGVKMAIVSITYHDMFDHRNTGHVNVPMQVGR